MMKKIVFYLFLAVSTFVLISSCTKEHAQKTTTQTINVTVNMNDEYSYDLGGFGDEEGASINRQASHYEESSLTRESIGNIIYHYQPALNYIGTDEVELKSAKGSDGTGPSHNILLTIITFTIVTR